LDPGTPFLEMITQHRFSRLGSSMLSCMEDASCPCGKRKGPEGPFRNWGLADQGQVRRRNLAVAAGFELIGNLVTLIQTLQARALHSRNVDKRVLLAILRRDEAKALGGVEEFHGAGDRRHRRPLGLVTADAAEGLIRAKRTPRLTVHKIRR